MGPTASILLDGRGLGADGWDGQRSPRGAEAFDPGTGTWRWVADMVEARRGHTATLLRDGRALVVGGSDDGVSLLASAELYVPSEGRWPSAGSINSGRWGHAALLTADGVVMLVGGSGFSALRSAEIYTPAGGEWSSGNAIVRLRGRVATPVRASCP